MKDHITLLGVFHIVYSGLGILAAGIVFLVIAGGGLLSGDREAIAITSTVAVVIASIILVFSIPGVIGGVGLLKRQAWARIVLLIVGIFDLFHIPIGTALGVYTIWVLTRPDITSYLDGFSSHPHSTSSTDHAVNL